MTLAQPANLRISLPLEELAQLCRRWKIERLEVFGSSLRQDFRADSDIDLLYTASPDAQWGWDIVDLRDELSALLNRPVHLVSRPAIEGFCNARKRELMLDGAQVIFMRPDEARIADIIGAARQIQTYIAGLSYEQFVANPMVCDAVVRQIEIIGEAASKISAEFKQTHGALPWRKMTDMRNVLIHQYEEVDLQQVWTVVTIHVPDLLEVLQK